LPGKELHPGTLAVESWLLLRYWDLCDGAGAYIPFRRLKEEGGRKKRNQHTGSAREDKNILTFTLWKIGERFWKMTRG
jgi:hypothetical protein